MTKNKRKLERTSKISTISRNPEKEEVKKTVAVMRDLSLNPSCKHGPTILFDRCGTRFFACSAYRNRKLCPFNLPEDKWIGVGDKDKKGVPQGEEGPSPKRTKVTSDFQPLQRDKGEAQYHFTEETVTLFIQILRGCGISGVICVGAPSVHQFILDNSSVGIKSFLLDIDDRLVNKYEPENFAMYNMCNHHFFREDGKKNYSKFLKGRDSVAVITDPPFGAKVELVWNGALQNIRKDWEKIKSDCTRFPFEIMWIFPYFMEGHFLSKCPDSGIKMSDYQVLYKNHAKFKAKEGKSKPSPVRLFTTIPLSKIKLPDISYRFCDICDKWVDRKNIHCNICETCTTKDGGDAYVHCDKCSKCVKPSWSHCSSCEKCHLNGSACNYNPFMNTMAVVNDASLKPNKRTKSVTVKRLNKKQRRNKRKTK